MPTVNSCPHCGHPTGRPAQAPWGYEWRSKTELFGWPLVHVAIGRDATTGKRRVARGIIAIGQFGFGLITVAQFGVGFLLGFGQFVCGILAMGQVAVGLLFALGQFASGIVAVGQVALGTYVLAQVGFGSHVFDTRGRDQEAVEFFRAIYRFFVAARLDL